LLAISFENQLIYKLQVNSDGNLSFGVKHTYAKKREKTKEKDEVNESRAGNPSRQVRGGRNENSTKDNSISQHKERRQVLQNGLISGVLNK
jgi:hypothetical protein